MRIGKHLAINLYCQRKGFWQATIFLCGTSLIFLSSSLSSLGEDTNLEQQIQILQHQNAALEQELQEENQSIKTLTERVNELEATNATQSVQASENAPPPVPTGYNLGNVNISGEGGVAFFDTGREGIAPDSQFRVDEARLFVEAPLWKEIYFQGEADLTTREDTEDVDLKMGELYLDAQDISDLWGRDGQLNFRVGRMYIPFGEEYLTRHAIDDPLITHSVSDFWGYDDGVEVYGGLGKFSYVVAVQNAGSGNGENDYNGDKSVAGRIGFDPNQHFHLSLSATRTGNISVQNDMLSAIWFGNGFFQNVGGTNASRFHVNLVEGDVAVRWAGGHLSAFGGYGHYNDNNGLANDAHDIFYYSAEGVQNLPEKFYAAIRFSQALSNKGIPIVGLAAPDDYFRTLTTELWRLSLGLGYRFNGNLILKTEYSFEGGRDLDGEARSYENFFGTEAAFRF